MVKVIQGQQRPEARAAICQLLLGYKHSVSSKSSFLPSCFLDLSRHTPSLNSFHVGAGLSSLPLFPCSFELISSGSFYHTQLSFTPPTSTSTPILTQMLTPVKPQFTQLLAQVWVFPTTNQPCLISSNT